MTSSLKGSESLNSSASSSVVLNQKANQSRGIALYDINNLETSPWPHTLDGQYAQNFLTPFIEKGVSQYIENVQTDLRVLVCDGLVLPITVNNAEYENSYVCSPHSYFISYAKDSLGFLSQAWLRYSMSALLVGLGKFLRKFHINKVVTVNNWLFSTNLYPQLQPYQIKQIVQFLKQSFPDHALVFRSVDPYTSPICYETLQPMGFEYIATRQIYFLESQTSTFFESRLFKSDMKLLKNSGYEIIGNEQLTEAEIPRLLELYRCVYIDKYSDLNPQFNKNFLQLVMKKKLMHFKAIKKDGRIDGVVGYVQRDGKMYCPFFGYDCHMPKEVALYRLLSTVLMLEAFERRLFFHQSSGASMFKTIRKAQSCIEYTAVFYKHLKKRRQLPWLMLKSLYNSVGAVYMKRY
jgi:hypothetical protein